jgi:sulfur-oxidizing protein SoxX
MKQDTMLLSALLTLGLLSGCDLSVKSGRGFVFPEGDIDRGREAFVDMKCVECHRVDGVVGLPTPTASLEKVVVLGGKVTRLKTYGELVTSIIHPKYALSDKLPNRSVYLDEGKPSPMRVVNDTMTVRQMLDIVTFLQPQYQGIEPVNEGYHIP